MQLLARALYIVLFYLKLLNKDGNWQVGQVCTVWMCEKEPEKPSEHTSEHVKSSGGMPPDPLTQYGPHFLYLSWAPTILLAALPLGTFLTPDLTTFLYW